MANLPLSLQCGSGSWTSGSQAGAPTLRRENAASTLIGVIPAFGARDTFIPASAHRAPPPRGACLGPASRRSQSDRLARLGAGPAQRI